MKIIFNSKLLNLLILTTLVLSCSENVEKKLDASRSAAQQLGSQLKVELKTSLKSKGPVESIKVCNIEAEKIALSVSNKNNMKVGRTSLKVRNHSNAPDAWEKEKLLYLEQQLLSGVDVKSLEVYEITNEDNEKWFRYMKAIPTSEVCLICHGGSVALPIRQKLQELYPNDQATGYKVGDLRGAFTVKVKK